MLEMLALLLWGMTFFTHCFSNFYVGKFLLMEKKEAVSVDIVFFLFFISISIIQHRRLIVTNLKSHFKYFGLFVIWAFIVNGYYTYEFSDLVFLRRSIEMLILLLFSISAYIKITGKHSDLYLNVMIICSTIGLVITTFSVLFFNRWGYFANPNQMGRFALLFAVVCMIIYNQKRWKFPEWLLASVFAMGIFLCVGTVKRAATLGFVLFFVFLMVRHFKLSILTGTLSVLLLGTYYLSPKGSLKGHLDRIESRLTENDQEDTFLGRGLYRILEYPEYLPFGAGEWRYYRFENRKGFEHYELHSTYGNLLFSYGIIGFLTFCMYQIKFISWDLNLLWLLLPVLAITTFNNDIRCIYFLILPFFFNKKIMLPKTTTLMKTVMM